jgi:hypothetical protein
VYLSRIAAAPEAKGESNSYRTDILNFKLIR